MQRFSLGYKTSTLYSFSIMFNSVENLKTDDDKLREEMLLSELVTVVHERSHLVDQMDEERLRYT